MSLPSRMFAVIPAAGHSRRMGQPKLLLTLAGVPIIERLLTALDHPSITTRHIVTRRSDQSLQTEVSRLGGSLIMPTTDPPDMRTSVALALATIERDYAPGDDEGWLLIPADHPVLDRKLIDAMMAHWNAVRPKILVPRSGQRRGHPTFFRWSLVRELSRIPPNRGLNWLLREFADEVAELPVESDAAITDLDTPEDYERLKARWEVSKPTLHAASD